MKGASLSDKDLNKPSEMESKYSFYKKTNDPSMGEISLLRNNQTDEVICFKEQVKNSKDQFA